LPVFRSCRAVSSISGDTLFAPKPLALCLGPAEAGLHALSNQLALKLSERAGHVEDAVSHESLLMKVEVEPKRPKST